MPDKTLKKRTWVQRVTSRYRLVVLNDDTFEEVASLKLTRLNVYILVSTLMVLLTTLVVSIIFFTPIRQYVPGYSGDVGLRKEVVKLKMRSDSLERITYAQEQIMSNIKQVITGNVPIVKTDTPVVKTTPRNNKYDSLQLSSVADVEKEFRKDLSKEENISLNNTGPVTGSSSRTISKSSLSGYYFFKPIKGYVSDSFDSKKDHVGIDLVAPDNEPVKATLDGQVIFAGWTSETGNVIMLQHDNNLISIYKHNAVLLKKSGEYVHAGDVISIIGNSGELTTGTHLHFELWYNGIALNPSEYINFN